MSPRLLILDRDGVINEDSPEFIKHPDEWHPIPGSLRALGMATRAGFRICIVSNQSGLARGLFSIEELHRIHHKLQQEALLLGAVIDGFFFCPHGPRHGCNCRKPQPGLLFAAAERSGLDLSAAVMIGDRESDLAAAKAAGARPVLVQTGHGASTLRALRTDWQVPVFEDLSAAVQALCSGELV